MVTVTVDKSECCEKLDRDQLKQIGRLNSRPSENLLKRQNLALNRPTFIDFQHYRDCCCLSPMGRNSVLEEFRVRRLLEKLDSMLAWFSLILTVMLVLTFAQH